MPVQASVIGCSTWRRAFSSMNEKRAVRAEQELEGAGVAVADEAAGALGGELHRLAQLGVERRRRRLLDQLLVAALERALALAEGEHVAVVVAEHLDLDVARRARAPSRRRGSPSPKAAAASAAGGREGVVELGRRPRRGASRARRRRRPP